MPINPNAPKTTPVAPAPARKAVVEQQPDKLKQDLVKQDLKNDQFVQAQQNPLASFGRAAASAPPAVLVNLVSSNVAANVGTAMLKELDQKKDAQTAETRAKAPARRESSFLSVIHDRFEVTKRAFQGAAEMLVGDRLLSKGKGFDLLSKLELTPKQQATVAGATGASKQAYRAGLLAHVGSEVSKKIVERNSNNPNIDPDVLQAAIKIADDFMGSV